jgi:hypothetical protein
MALGFPFKFVKGSRFDCQLCAKGRSQAPKMVFHVLEYRMMVKAAASKSRHDVGHAR